METTDFQRFKAVMAGMARVFGAEIDKPLLDGYWLALRDWQIADFEGAAAHLMGSSKFMPRPADFNELRKKASEQSAGEAWEKVLKAIRTMYVREGASVDAKTDAVVRQMGGYAHLALMPSEDLKFRARDFQTLWADMGEVEEARTALPNLTGGAKLSGPQGFGKLLERRA